MNVAGRKILFVVVFGPGVPPGRLEVGIGEEVL